jgi:exonuclease III
VKLPAELQARLEAVTSRLPSSALQEGEAAAETALRLTLEAGLEVVEARYPAPARASSGARTSLRVAGLNLNNRIHTRRDEFLDWLTFWEPDVVAIQEVTRRNSGLPAIPGYTWSGGTELCAILTKTSLQAPPAVVLDAEQRWVRMKLGEQVIDSVYFPSDTARRRADFLDALVAGAHPGSASLVLGDFNMAPKPADGLFKGAPSAFTKQYERQKLDHLMQRWGLEDLWLQHSGGGHRFTFERKQRGGWVQFRCDLALGSETLPVSSIVHAHDTRLGASPFTDHSGVIVDLTESNGVQVQPANTAISRKGPSRPVQALWQQGHISTGQRVLDMGCGRGADVAWLGMQGVQAVGWDPHPAFGFTQAPEGVYDAVLLIYVVNVLPTPQQRIQAIKGAWAHVRQGGLLVVVSRTRSEIERQAEGRWRRHEDGWLSVPARGTFQKGYDASGLQRLVAGFPDMEMVVADHNSGAARLLARRL